MRDFYKTRDSAFAVLPGNGAKNLTRLGFRLVYGRPKCRPSSYNIELGSPSVEPQGVVGKEESNHKL